MMDPAARDSLPGGYGDLLLTSFLVLTLVCILVWAMGRFGASRWRQIGRGRSRGPIQVVARAPLGVGQTLYLIEVPGRSLLLGACEGQLSLLAELEPESRTAESVAISRGGAAADARRPDDADSPAEEPGHVA